MLHPPSKIDHSYFLILTNLYKYYNYFKNISSVGHIEREIKAFRMQLRRCNNVDFSLNRPKKIFFDPKIPLMLELIRNKIKFIILFQDYIRKTGDIKISSQL